MTVEQLKSLPHGTKVVWSGQFQGYVVNLIKSKPNAEGPLIYIQWEDGERTDGNDSWALIRVQTKD